MSRTIAFGAKLIHLTANERKLEAGLGLGVNCFLDQLIPAVEFSPALFHLGLYQLLESLIKKSDESGLFWGPVSIELYKDGLEMLEVRSPVLDFFLSVLRVFLAPTPDGVSKSPRITKVPPQKSFKLNSR